MKNIRSIVTAALSVMLLLSATASNGMFSSIASALKGISFKGAREQVIETIKAHPYISGTIAATPFVGYGLYKAGKYAFGKKAVTIAEIDKAFAELDAALDEAIIIAKFEKAISDQLNDMHVHVIQPAKDPETQIDQRRAQVARARAFIQLAGTLIANLEKLSDSYKNTAFKKAAVKVINSIIEFNKAGTNDALNNVKKAVDEMKTLSTQQTLTQKVVASLSSKTALIAAGITAVAVPAIYAYKNG